MSNEQFYPTPSALAYKAFQKFKNRDFKRVLEPSAGTGDLLEPFKSRTQFKIDVIEIDLDKQAVLRSKGYQVIDADFETSMPSAYYDAIIMNPPFSRGCEHVLKAWDLIVSGEVVAIVNAETIRNPHTQKRKHLVSLIEQYGDYEFIQEAFTDPDTKRKTNVEVALIHLEKVVDIRQNFTDNLEIDFSHGIEQEARTDLAVKESTITNSVIAFNAAVEALKRSEMAREEYFYYAGMLNLSFNQMTGIKDDYKFRSLQERFNDSYDGLREQAWKNILQSTEFSKHLSSKAYEKLLADFTQVSKLSFTESNIRGFLIGLINAQSTMNMEMILECFDQITRYIPENKAYYMGWKSNLKHKVKAYRIQMTRFILPNVKSYSWSSISWETLNKLADWDKVFCVLDGKSYDAKDENGKLVRYGVSDLLGNADALAELQQGKRLSTDYFDIRYYPGVGTIHFFPTNKKLIDRFNRLVGRERQWLPQDDKQASKDFWKQYDNAEKISKAIVMPRNLRNWELEQDERVQEFMDAHLVACEQHGIDTSTLLGLTKAA